MLRDAEGGMPCAGSLHAYIAAQVRAPSDIEGTLHYSVVTDRLPRPSADQSPAPSPAAHSGEFLAIRRLVLVFFTPKKVESAHSYVRHSFPGAGLRGRVVDNSMLCDTLAPHSAAESRPQTPSQACGDLVSALALNSSPEAARPHIRPQQRLLVFGMTVAEYAHSHEPERASRVYIQHVDSTGLVCPRRSQSAICRAVVLAYLGYTQAVLRAPYVHVFASPKPSLIFCGSEGLVGLKTVLDGPRLAVWWLSLLHQHAVSVPGISTGHVYAPAEDRAPAFVASLRSWAAQHTAVRWHYGYACCSRHTAFGVDDSDGLAQDSAARTVFVPLFEDDPKWRHFEAVYVDGDVEEGRDSVAKRTRTSGNRRRASAPTSLAEFFQTLGYRSEFMQEPSALIVLRQPVRSSPSGMDTSGEAPCAAHVSKLMRSLSFATPDDAAVSSLRVWAWLKVMGATVTEILPAESNLFAPAPRSEHTLPGTQSAPMHSVQSLVRRKPVLAVRSSSRVPFYPSPMSSTEYVAFPDAQ